MNQFKANLVHAVSNWHVTIPTLLGAGLAVAIIWLPQYSTQLTATAGVLVSYGVIAAANTPANKQNPPQT